MNGLLIKAEWKMPEAKANLTPKPEASNKLSGSIPWRLEWPNSGISIALFHTPYGSTI